MFCSDNSWCIFNGKTTYTGHRCFLEKFIKVKIGLILAHFAPTPPISLHASDRCLGPALSPKWLENYMEPHASSEILTRSDLTIWLNPKPIKVLAHKLFRDVQAPSRGSGGMLSQKILKISVLKFAENAFLTS